MVDASSCPSSGFGKAGGVGASSCSHVTAVKGDINMVNPHRKEGNRNIVGIPEGVIPYEVTSCTYDRGA